MDYKILYLFFFFSVLAVCSAMPLMAQRLLIGNIAYESPSLIAPVALYRTMPSDGDDWTFSITGWTGAVQWERVIDPTFTSAVTLEVTPMNSHSSDILFRNGIRDKALNFFDATMQFRAGMNIQSTEFWSTNIGVIGIYESVKRLPEEVLEYWRSPFAGIDILTSYIDTRSDDPMIGRWDGIKLFGHAQVLAGFEHATAWWRITAISEAGRKFGPVFLHGGGSAFLGNSLNIVNQFLVGGCWDLLGAAALSGYHYAEFRLNRAAVFQAAADVCIAGSTELGLRAGYLLSDEVATFGGALKMMTTISGFTFEIGIGLPKAVLVSRDFGKIVGFGGMTFGLFP